jgi:hypothetical protein
MTIKPRLLPVMGAALLSISVAGALNAKEAAKVQLPDQVLTDGAAQSTPAAAPAAARSAAPAAAKAAAPSAAELEAKLIHMTSESSAGLVAVKSASGGQRMNLDERFMSVVVAVPTEDGHVETSCVTGDDALHTAHVAQKMSAGEMPKKKPSLAPARLEEK